MKTPESQEVASIAPSTLPSTVGAGSPHADVPISSVYAQIIEFAREAGAQRVILFGSRARGTNGPKSDIDLAIEGCPDFPSLEDRLQEELWSLLQLDVINLDGKVSAELRSDIKRDGRVLYDASQVKP